MNENLNEFNRMKLNWENKRNFCKKKKMNFQVLFFFQIVDRLSSNRWNEWHRLNNSLCMKTCSTQKRIQRQPKFQCQWFDLIEFVDSNNAFCLPLKWKAIIQMDRLYSGQVQMFTLLKEHFFLCIFVTNQFQYRTIYLNNILMIFLFKMQKRNIFFSWLGHIFDDIYPMANGQLIVAGSSQKMHAIHIFFYYILQLLLEHSYHLTVWKFVLSFDFLMEKKKINTHTIGNVNRQFRKNPRDGAVH